MNKLINIKNEDGKQLVSAKELYLGLGLNKTNWSRWYPTNLTNNDYFKENVDWVRHDDEGAEIVDFAITIDFAKHIAMMARTEKSHDYRNYFIKCEKQLQDNIKIPSSYKEALLQLIQAEEEKEILVLGNKQKDQLIGELKPRADYTDKILKNTGLVNITQISKDYGMSAQEMNTLLHEFKIQYKQSGQWLLYANQHDKGYTHSETIPIVRSDGRKDIRMSTKWTQKGRLFLYNLLKDNNVLPVIEHVEEL